VRYGLSRSVTQSLWRRTSRHIWRLYVAPRRTMMTSWATRNVLGDIDSSSALQRHGAYLTCLLRTIPYNRRAVSEFKALFSI